ncbi:MAG TPA: M28 family peptidase [Gemmatimonadaceae bacterium]|nr:M28 family peptidase [Gemmatimonadaceae bacterium]
MATTSARRAVVTTLALLVLCGLLVRDAARPPAPLPASAPSTEFSAERALAHVREIAQRPHPIGSPDNVRVREYVLAQLRALGLEPEVQATTGVGTRYPEAGRVVNVMTRLPGKTPGGLAVVLMAHYDGVAGGPAAGDDAAGAAAVLETLRALKAGPPLAHDVIALITDGEEAGLLGAAAFVRSHAWAKDVGVTLNFEARGTTGRSYMFETGPGNLDVARVLRGAGDVSATSLSVTVYRTLPNDTDLSEMALLNKPALNFAFADGVERYHTAHDDVEHLNPGSLQHHGQQMLTLARAFGDGPLPRPATGDAVFFDVPLLGLIVYPELWAWAITIVAVALVIAALLRAARGPGRSAWDALVGAVGIVVSTAVAGALGMGIASAIAQAHTTMGWGGAPAFRGVYAAALGLVSLAAALAGWAIVRRRATVAGAYAGALAVWAVLTILVTWKLPGVSFLFAWPLIAAAIAARVSSKPPLSSGARVTPTLGAEIWVWIATVVGAAIVVPIVYAVSAVMLGIVGAGGIAAAILVSLLAWVLAPQMESLGSGRPWRAVVLTAVAAAVTICVGMVIVRSSPSHPTSSQIVYALDADSAGAWIAARGKARALVTGSTETTQIPAWIAQAFGPRAASYRSVPRVVVAAPTVTVVRDSSSAQERRLELLVRAAPGSETVGLRALDARVLRSQVDGLPIGTSRYRGGVRQWSLDYSAPPDSGFTVTLVVPAGAGLGLDVIARRPGLPALDGIVFAARPADVVTVQTGDVTVVHRVVRLP